MLVYLSSESQCFLKLKEVKKVSAHRIWLIQTLIPLRCLSGNHTLYACSRLLDYVFRHLMNPAEESFSLVLQWQPASPSALRAVLCSMKKSLLLIQTWLACHLRTWTGMDADVDRNSLIDWASNRWISSSFCVLCCLSFIVCFVSSLFQIDTNKSITQKRLKKVSEPVAIFFF